MPANESNRILSIDSRESVKQCPEGEEAYFRTYPDVAKNWKSTAYRHWKRYRKDEMRHYICMGHNSEDKAVSVRGKKKDNGFVVVAIFKNEAMNFAEWISHYLWQGASHFYLIDNGSTDDWKLTIPAEVRERITVTRDEERHFQDRKLASLLPMLQKKHMHDWAVMLDLDEFLYAKPPETISTYLSSLSDDIGQVIIGWTIFGSSGFVSHPKSVRCSFVMSGKKSYGWKSAVRISSIEKINIHKHYLKPGFKDHWENMHKHLLKPPGFKNHRGRDRLQLNHYRIQSKEYFGKAKMLRGDVQSGGRGFKRTWDYFNETDKTYSDHADTELCSILGCCAS